MGSADYPLTGSVVITPFRVAVVDRTRWPDNMPDVGWARGVPHGYLQQLVPAQQIGRPNVAVIGVIKRKSGLVICLRPRGCAPTPRAGAALSRGMVRPE